MIKRLFVILLVFGMLFSGCEYAGGEAPISPENLAFQDFEYTRPDLTELDEMLIKCQNYIDEDRPISNIVMSINVIYSLYDTFYTNLNLADIHYCLDMTDEYWSKEYAYCSDLVGEVEAKLESLYVMLAKSQYRQELEGDDYFGAGFFDAYLTGSVWDDIYLNLSAEESRLQSEYYTVCAEAGLVDYSQSFYDTYGLRLAEILVELIEVRQKIAKHLGYDSYAQMAYEGIYGRDYSAQDAKSYMQNIGNSLSDVYADAFYDEVWLYGATECTEEQVFQYAQDTANYLGGKTQEAFEVMQDRKLYDITYSPNKFENSFCLYLTDYEAPYIFVSPWNQTVDQLTLIHEFGHFANEYICSGSYVSTDISEIQSQGMEYISLCRTKDSELIRYKMADSLSVYVDQSAYGLFELELYELEGEDLTVENVIACYERICHDFSVDLGTWNKMSFVNVSHFYTSPMYIVSYVVSNDLAFQFYQMELEQTGKGRKKYSNCLSSEDTYIMDFVEKYGLEDPFSKERVEKVKDFFEETFASAKQAA